MLEAIRTKPFLVAILAGACAQWLKVVAFLVVEGKVNYRRFVQADGMPNMHSATFSALTVAVGMKEGFDSLTFAFSLCLTAIIVVDTMNVRKATSRHAEAILLLLDRLRHRTVDGERNSRRLSYSRLDVFTGLLVGAGLALVLF